MSSDPDVGRHGVPIVQEEVKVFVWHSNAPTGLQEGFGEPLASLPDPGKGKLSLALFNVVKVPSP